MGDIKPGGAQVLLDLLPDGRVQITATCGGVPDSRYAPIASERVPVEVNRLLVELQERLAASPELPAGSGSPDSEEAPGVGGRAGLDLFSSVAVAADAVNADDSQNGLLLADIEARLTNEVRGLICALDQFGRRAQFIGKELPDSAHFCKSVTSLLALLGFQLANSFGKGLDLPVFFDDGAEYLRKLNLSLGDFVRELTLDGRRFLAVALVDEQLDKFGCPADRSDKC